MKIGICGALLNFVEESFLCKMAVDAGFEVLSLTGKQVASLERADRNIACLDEVCWFPEEGISLFETAIRTEKSGATTSVIPGNLADEYKDEICSAVNALKINFAFENSPHGENVIEIADKWNRELNCERFYICLNTGHAILCRITPDKIVCEHSERLVSLHINDNHGKSDLHLMPYRGRSFMDWSEFLSSLSKCGYKGNFCFDVYSEPARQSELLAKGWINSQACLARYMQTIVSSDAN